eukprot:gene15448-21533_t
MDTDAHGLPFSTEHNGFYGKETTSWFKRADSADKDRFSRVFADMETVSLRGKSLPDEATLLEESRINKSAVRRHNSTTDSTNPPGGWAYTSTRSARKPPKAPVSPETADGRPSQDQQQAESPTAYKQPASRQRPLSAPASKLSSDTVSLQVAKFARDMKLQEERDKESRQERTEPRYNLDKSIYTTAYSLHEEHPELYEAAREAGKAVQTHDKFSSAARSMQSTAELREKLMKSTYSRTDEEFSSAARSMQSTVDAELREKLMKSTYTRTNEEVAPGGQLASEADKKEGLYKWMQKQRTYYNDILPDASKPDMDTLMGESPLEKKEEIVDALRQVHATLNPGQFKSHSQEEHCHMVPVDDQASLQQARELVQLKTVGRGIYQPTKEELEATRLELEQNGEQIMQRTDNPSLGLGWIGYSDVRMHNNSTNRPTSAPSASAAARSRPTTAVASRQVDRTTYLGGLSATQQRGRPVSAPRSSVDAHSPNAGFGLVVGKATTSVRPSSANPTSKSLQQQRQAGGYKPRIKPETHKSKVPLKWAGMSGPTVSSYTDTYQRHRTDTRTPIKYQGFTQPAGAVNPYTAMVPFREAYPVTESFVKHIPFPHGTDGTFAAAATTHRVAFAARDQKDVMRTMKAAAAATEEARKALQRSTLPLGKNAPSLCEPKQWKTEHADEFISRTSDYLVENRNQAARVKEVFEGPTASTGRSTKPH